MNKSLMQIIYMATLLVTTSLLAFGFDGNPAMPSPSVIRDALNVTPPDSFLAQLGTQMTDHKLQMKKATYRYTRDAGTSSLTVFLKDVDGKDAVIPAKAIIKQVLIEVLNAANQHTASGYSNPKISFGIHSPIDLKAATAYTSFSAAALVAGGPIGTAATMVKVLRSTLLHSVLQMQITEGSLIGGDFNIFVEYYLSD